MQWQNSIWSFLRPSKYVKISAQTWPTRHKFVSTVPSSCATAMASDPWSDTFFSSIMTTLRRCFWVIACYGKRWKKTNGWVFNYCFDFLLKTSSFGNMLIISSMIYAFQVFPNGGLHLQVSAYIYNYYTVHLCPEGVFIFSRACSFFILFFL